MRIFLIAVLFFVAGCETVTHYAHRPDFSLISMGMSQQDVIAVMGKPQDISAQGGRVYLQYAYAPWYDHSGADGHKELYFVRLIDDKVESFGAKGDFDSTKPETIRIELDTN